MKKTIGVIALILAMTTSLSSCTKDENTDTPTAPSAPTPNPELVKNTIEATIELENGDEIVLELYPDIAPETVENFIELAEDGFYDGTIFHRVIEGFMIQGGGYDENLKEQDADTIEGEFAANGFENSLSHDRGVISMARTAQNMNSASSQFFIMQEYAPHLDGQYAAFGKVIEGIEIVDDIASVKTGTVAASGMQDVPVEPIIIESITVDTGNVSSKKADKDDEKKSDSKSDKDDTKSDDKDTDAETLTEEDIMALFGNSSES
ncbi:MAG: peptidylprolyl isomerase [Clostridia bacterium]|nr:peptidylprolyl isomerase [Clostridia bacterium]